MPLKYGRTLAQGAIDPVGKERHGAPEIWWNNGVKSKTGKAREQTERFAHIGVGGGCALCQRTNAKKILPRRPPACASAMRLSRHVLRRNSGHLVGSEGLQRFQDVHCLLQLYVNEFLVVPRFPGKFLDVLG